MASGSRKEVVKLPGVSFVQELDGIYEYLLTKNGLRILLAPDTTQPVAGCMVTYAVGSRNEATGYTGATHMLEHLLFKESKNFRKKDKRTSLHLLETKGTAINATTWFDRTNYYAVLPKELLETAIAIEGDRMRNAIITKHYRDNEMTIVRNEYEMGENNPLRALDKEIWAAAFQAHPYHTPTIGWLSDIENVPTERLQQFYDDFYWPDNATVTIVGGFDQKEVLGLVKKYFGVHSKNPKPLPDIYTVEPPQEGQRRVVINRNGFNALCLAFKIPGARHPDQAPLEVLGTLLAGGKTSRLYRALVDTGIATNVSAQWVQLRDPSLFQVFAVLADGKTHAEAEAAILRELEAMAQTEVSEEELAKVKRLIRSSLANQRDGVYDLLDSLNDQIATGDWTLYAKMPKQYQKVTNTAVARAAKTYFRENQSTVGWFVSTPQ